MPDLPTGTVTLLFTDIEGSTLLLRELGDRYAGVVEEHRRRLREAFARHGGVEVDTQGDAFFVAFPRARAAVDAALEARSGLASTPVRIRIGIHTGEPTISDDRYVGLDVVVAARICAVTHGAQIVVSQATRDLIDKDVRDLGDHRFKDLPEPLRLYQLGEDEFPPLRWARIRQGRLAEALAFERESFQLATRLEYTVVCRWCLQHLAIVLAQCRGFQRAAQLLAKNQALTEELLGDRASTSKPDEFLASADAQVRGGLTEDERLEAMSIGRNADLKQLLEAALVEAETAVAAGGTKATTA